MSFGVIELALFMVIVGAAILTICFLKKGK